MLEGVIPLETFPLVEWRELADVPSFTVLKTQICVTRPQCVNTPLVRLCDTLGDLQQPPGHYDSMKLLSCNCCVCQLNMRVLSNVTKPNVRKHALFVTINNVMLNIQRWMPNLSDGEHDPHSRNITCASHRRNKRRSVDTDYRSNWITLHCFSTYLVHTSFNCQKTKSAVYGTACFVTTASSLPSDSILSPAWRVRRPLTESLPIPAKAGFRITCLLTEQMSSVLCHGRKGEACFCL